MKNLTISEKIQFILAFILFIIFLIFIYVFNMPFVAAATPEGWAYDISQPSFAGVYDCSSSDCNVSLDARVVNIDSQHFYYSSYNQTNLTANGNGYMWVYLPDTPLINTNIYSITTYICGETNYSNLVFKGMYSSNYLSNVYGKVQTGTVYYSQSINNLNTYPYGSQNGAQYQCSYVNVVYKPNSNSSYVGLNVTTNANSYNYSSALIGYSMNLLGSANNLSSQDIQNIINSSGLATSSDVSSLNSAISNIQSQLSSNITSAQNNINNNIDQAESNIINNQNENTNKEIESQKVCSSLSASNKNTYVGSNGVLASSNYWNSSDYIDITTGDLKYKSSLNSNGGTYYCFYNESKTNISCSLTPTTGSGVISIPTGASYFRFSNTLGGEPIYSLCKNGNQSLSDDINDLNSKITDSAVTGGIGLLTGWFDDFNSNSFGLTSIITAPLDLIRSITSKTCTPLHLTIPFINTSMDLPCMTSIYSEFFGSFLTLYQTITFGITSYWICVRIFNLVKDFKNPDHDEIEVMDL